jgi:hypothetical protein
MQFVVAGQSLQDKQVERPGRDLVPLINKWRDIDSLCHIGSGGNREEHEDVSDWHSNAAHIFSILAIFCREWDLSAEDSKRQQRRAKYIATVLDQKGREENPLTEYPSTNV